MSIDSPVAILFNSDGYEMASKDGYVITAANSGLLGLGSDGTNAHYFKTDSSGRLVIVGLGTAGSSAGGVLSVQGVASGTAIPVSGTVAATQSGTWSNRLLDGYGNQINSATSNPIGTETGLIVRNIPSGTQTVGGTVAATQSGTWNVGTVTTITNVVHVDDNAGSLTVDGTITANQGGAPWSQNLIQINGNTVLAGNGVTGTGSPRVTIASDNTAFSVNNNDGYGIKLTAATTAPVGAETGLIVRNIPSGTQTVAGSGNFTVVQPTGTNLHTVTDSGTITTVSTVTNLSQLAGNAISMNTGVRDAGTQRVTIATNDVVPVSQSGTWTVQPGNTANTTPWLTTINQGGNSAAVSASNALKVDGSAVTQPVSGTVTANQGGAPWSQNITQINGVALLAGNGVTGTGSPRVTIASDNTAFSVNNNDGYGVKLTAATIAPVGTETGLIVRNIPSGTQTISGTVAATQSGTWSNRLLDGYGNQISSATSTPVGTETGLMVRNILTDRTGSGTIIALNGTIAANTQGCSSIIFVVTGTWVATVTTEGTVDGVNWFSIITSDQSQTITTTFTSNQRCFINCSGMLQVRLNATAFTSGTILASWDSSIGGPQLFQVWNTNATSLKVQARLQDSLANNITTQANGAQRAMDVGIDVAGVQVDPRLTFDGYSNAISSSTTNPLGTETGLIVRNIPSGTQTISGTITANQGGAPWSQNLTQVNGVALLTGNGVTGTGSPRVTIASDNTAFTVNAAQSGTWNINNISGTISLPTGASTSANQTTIGNQTTKINDGTNTAAVKAASTSPVATDPALVVTISPNSSVIEVGNKTNNNAAPGSNNIGALTVLANAAAPTWTEGNLVTLSSLLNGSLRTDNTTWFGSSAPTVGSKTSANSIPVVIASDQGAVAISAASLPLPTGAATAANQTTVGNQTTKINDGTTTATIKAASTAAVATDTALVVAISPNNSLTVSPSTSSTATTSSVVSSASSVTLLTSNASRKGATIYNDSTKILYVKLGTTASTTDFTTQLAKDDYYEVPFGFTGRIDGIWSAANGNARLTELT